MLRMVAWQSVVNGHCKQMTRTIYVPLLVFVFREVLASSGSYKAAGSKCCPSCRKVLNMRT